MTIELPDYNSIKHLDIIREKLMIPKNNNKHNALSDAKWNLELYNHLKDMIDIDFEQYKLLRIQKHRR